MIGAGRSGFVSVTRISSMRPTILYISERTNDAESGKYVDQAYPIQSKNHKGLISETNIIVFGRITPLT